MGAIYFWLFAAVAVWAPFLPVHLKGLGLSGTEIGLLMAVTPLVNLAAQPLGGALADRYGRARVLQFLLPAAALFSAVTGPATGFWALAGLLACFAVTFGPSVPLADGLTLAHLEREGGEYGPIRAWGSVAFAVAVQAAGWWFGAAGTRSLFLLTALLLLAAWLAVRRVAGLDPAPPGARSGGTVGAVLRSGTVALALVVTFILQLANAGHNTFFGVYLESLGGSRGQIGLGYALAAAAEIPVIFWSGPVIRRLGVLRALVLASLVYAGRYLALAFVTHPGLAVALQVAHSVSFGLSWPALVLLVAEQTPPHLRTTGQGLLAGIGFGLANVVGAVAAGWLADRFGLPAVYLAMGLLAAAAAGGWVLLARLGRAPASPGAPVPDSAAPPRR